MIFVTIGSMFPFDRMIRMRTFDSWTHEQDIRRATGLPANLASPGAQVTAVQEARTQGLTPFAVTIDDAGHDYLPYLFGQQGYALVHRPRDLAQRLAAVYSQITRQ